MPAFLPNGRQQGDRADCFEPRSTLLERRQQLRTLGDSQSRPTTPVAENSGRDIEQSPCAAIRSRPGHISGGSTNNTAIRRGSPVGGGDHGAAQPASIVELERTGDAVREHGPGRRARVRLSDLIGDAGPAGNAGGTSAGGGNGRVRKSPSAAPASFGGSAQVPRNAAGARAAGQSADGGPAPIDETRPPG